MARLRDLIEEKGVTQKKVADDLGWPRRTLNNYVNSQREPDHKALCQLCDYFNCTADYLLGRSNSRLPAVSEEDAAVLRAYHSLPLPILQAVNGLLEPYMTSSEADQKMA